MAFKAHTFPGSEINALGLSNTILLSLHTPPSTTILYPFANINPIMMEDLTL